MSVLIPMQIEQLLASCRATKNYNALYLYVIRDDTAKDILQQINKYISIAQNRDKGFEYLHKILPFCSSEILSEHAINWINICLSPTQKGPIIKTRLNIIASLIPLCTKIQEFNKSMTTIYLPKIIEASIAKTLQEKQFIQALDCIEVCLKNYSSTCSPFRNKIEKFLFSFIDTENSKYLQQKVGKCLHYLQQVGGAGTDKINHINNWSTELKKLCKTLHKIYNKFFEDITEFEDYDNADALSHEFAPLSVTTKLDALLTLSKRLKHLTLYVRTFLETGYPAPKSIPVQQLLDVIKRGVSVHHCIVKENLSTEMFNFSALLLDHQKDLLYLFRSLITCLHQNVIPFSFIITKMYIDLYSRMHTCNCYNVMSDHNKAFHITFSYWLEIIKTNMNSTFHDKLIPMLIQDIEPTNTGVVLNLNINLSHRKSSKAKKRAMRDHIINNTASTESTARSAIGVLNNKSESCMYALNTLSIFLQNVTLKMQKENLNKLCNTILETIIQIQEAKVGYPYTDLKCQMKIYYVLLSLIKQPATITTAHIETCMKLFTNGSKNASLEVANICFAGIKLLEIVCQPICPSFYISHSVKDKNKSDIIEVQESDIEEILSDGENVEANIITNEEQETKDLSSKVKILDVVVIKPPDVIQTDNYLDDKLVKVITNGDNNIKDDALNKSADIESDDNLNNIDLTVPDIEEVNETSEIIEISDDKGNTSEVVEISDEKANISNENIESKMEESASVDQIVDSEIVHIDSPPPSKKAKINGDESKYDDMINSFVDVVND